MALLIMEIGLTVYVGVEVFKHGPVAKNIEANGSITSSKGKEFSKAYPEWAVGNTKEISAIIYAMVRANLNGQTNQLLWELGKTIKQ